MTRLKMSIHDQCESGHYDAVKERLDSTDGLVTLLEKRSYVYNDTPLLVAAHAGQTRIVQLLLSYGADVNAQDGQGNTALHLAAKSDNVMCAEVLLRAENVRIDLTNKGHRTPYGAAKKSQNIKKLLKSAEIVQAARDKATGLEEMLERLHQEETSPTCFTEAMVAAVTQGNAETANTIICSVAKKIEGTAQNGHNLDLEKCVRAALENGYTKLAATLFVCLLVGKNLLRDIRYFFRDHDDSDCSGLMSTLVPPSRDMSEFTEDLRDHCRNLKMCDLKAPISFAVACDKMEAAKILLWHDCFKPQARSTVLWCKLGLTTVHSLWINDSQSADFYSKLERLDLRDNKLRSIAPEIFKLFALNTLLLDKNELSELPKVGRWSTTLGTLSLCENKLESLPDCLGSSQIRNLKIRSNRFTRVPLCICNLVSLESLDMSDNPKITALPLQMGKLSNLKYLLFDEKKITYPVDWEKRNDTVHGLIGWLKEKFRESQSDRRVKLMVTGWQGKGKTTLVRRLRKNFEYNGNFATEGIEISEAIITQRRGSFPFRKQEEPISFQVWDFAGHDAFYVTHVCFLSAFALYLLVWNLDDGLQGIGKLSSWLDMITARAFSKHPRTLPLIIVGTHLDVLRKDGREDYIRRMRDDIDRLLVERGDQDLVVKIVEVSCEQDCREGIDKLEHTVCDLAREMVKMVGTEGAPVRVLQERVPQVFLTLIDKIEDMRAGFRQENKPPIMTEHQLKETIKSVIKDDQHPNDFADATLFLQERGVILHYDDTSGMLHDLYFIDPYWLCDLMKKVITEKVLGLVNSEGILKTSDLPFLLKEDRFPAESHSSFIELLNRFQLTFSLSNGRVLVPSKLPEAKPKEARTDDTECELIKRIYRLPHLPYGFCSRLIARILYHLKDMLAEAKQQGRVSPCVVSDLIGRELLCWRSGVYFRKPSVLFEVGFSPLPSGGKELKIHVSSNEPGKCILNHIVDHIETLISEWFNGMNKRIERLIPCSACEKANCEAHQFFLDEYVDGCDDCGGIDGAGGDAVVGDAVGGIDCGGIDCAGGDRAGGSSDDVGVGYVVGYDSGCSGDGGGGDGGSNENTIGAHFKCIKQDVVLPLHQVAPDLTFQDIEPHLIIPNGQLQYDKEHALGKGSSGTVYRGEHGNKPAAIKEFKEQSYREVRKEVNVLRRVTCHANFVSLFGVSRRPLCIVMELVSKGSLEGILFDTPALQISRLVRMAMACEVSDALSYLHHLGIVYRDLRPANILVQSLDETQRVHVKLSDFGTAAFVGPCGLKKPVSPTRICAPEMLEFASMEKYGTKVDIFSLGVLFYNLITRKQAFHELQDSAKIKQCVVRSARPPWKDDPESVYSLVNLSQLMCLCWDPTAALRPSAAQAHEQLVKPVFQALMGKFALSRSQTLQCISYFPGVRQTWIAFKADAKTFVSVFHMDEQELRKPCLVCGDSSSLLLKFMCPWGESVMLVFENDEGQVVLKPCPFESPESTDDNTTIQLQRGALNDVIVQGNDVILPDPSNSSDVTIGEHDVMTSSEKGCLLLSSRDIHNTSPLRCLTSEVCSVVVAGDDELWLGVEDSISVSSRRPEPSVTVLSGLAGDRQSTRTSLAIDGQHVWSLRNDELTKWSCETKQSVLSRDCAAGQFHSTASLTDLPIFGHVTCFAPARDTVWLGTGSGHIFILDASSGEVLAWFRPYKTEVKSLTFCADADPPRMISCGVELGELSLGMSGDTCPVERGELIVIDKPCEGQSRGKGSRKRRRATPYTWSAVDPKELGHVLLMWHALPARVFVDNR